jgi:malate dehydrogenase
MAFWNKIECRICHANNEIRKFMKKISLIGAGQIGGTLAHLIGTKEVANEVVLFDVASGIAKGKALDIAQSSSVDGFNVRFSGTDNYEDIKDSNVIIITAGVPRKPGMTRDDLLGINLKIIKQVAEGIKKNTPNAFVICITNPLDVMVMAFQKFSGLPANKVVGMAGILDSSRFKLFLSLELDVPVKEIEAIVMGGHGDTMVPLPRFTKVSGKPLLDLVKEGKISSERLEEINQRTRDGGGEIVKYLEKGSAFYAPAASGVQMAEAYLKDEKKLLPCAVHLNGEYGVDNVYAGVPVIIGKNGVEKIEQIDLDEKEKKEFMNSIDAVKALWEAASKIDPDLSK